MTALLELRDIRRSYPSGDGSVEVLKGITLSIHAGEMVAIVGASGDMEGEPILATVMISISGRKAYIVQALGAQESFTDSQDMLVEIISCFRAR